MTSYLTSLSVSPTGTYIASGDAEGVIHLLSQAPEDTSLPLNGFDGQPIPWADHSEPMPDIEWTDSTYAGFPYSLRLRSPKLILIAGP